MEVDTPKEKLEKLALENENTSKKWIADKKVKKIIIIPNKVVNLVI